MPDVLPSKDCPPLSDVAQLRGAATWVFDLDNTLYPATDSLFGEIGIRIRDYIARFLDLETEAAQALKQKYFLTYGTSLRGMMLEHRMDPLPFLEFVHDVDLSGIRANPALDRALTGLPGRKIIFTNADVPHAERILTRLGIARHFDAIFDIADADYVPKPEPGPYDTLVRLHALKPGTAVMVDDIARNLAPAAERGLTTAWIRNGTEWGSPGNEGGHIHHRVDDLTAWLEGIANGGGGA
mgnify:CR=1 FL=1